MSRIISLVFISLILVFGLGCQTSKKKMDETSVDEAPIDVSNDPDMTSKAISFDPMGSDSGNIEGLQTVNFGYDKSSLTATAQNILSENANWIRDKNNLTIQIEGHCDSRGSIEYNLSLGERRAKAVKNYLVGLGIESERITTISYGKEKPLAEGDSESVHAQNRRANFVPISQ